VGLFIIVDVRCHLLLVILLFDLSIAQQTAAFVYLSRLLCRIVTWIRTLTSVSFDHDSCI
jgi:hypothetical protein